jgi:pyruvate-ferredoxin/flavodoxin oxidoreductase
MMIANATGCSSIWGASAPSMAYAANAAGRGPAWASSLFEDNAEYGFGMYLGYQQLRSRLAELTRKALDGPLADDLRTALQNWLSVMDDGPASLNAALTVKKLLKQYALKDPNVRDILSLKDYLEKRSVWMIGGDGWAYDIGYGGVDHVLASGEDVNLFVMDTEVYSNTGGQASKSTPAGAVAKFAFKGKPTRKKDLGRMAITYGNVYVAQIALGADMNHTLKAILEAESYPGPSLLIAYAPCISHGIKAGMAGSVHEEKKAVEAGYWHLYRYDPRVADEGQNPFRLDSKEPAASYRDFLMGEIRYSQLQNTFPDTAEQLFAAAGQQARERWEAYKKLSGDS